MLLEARVRVVLYDIEWIPLGHQMLIIYGLQLPLLCQVLILINEKYENCLQLGSYAFILVGLLVTVGVGEDFVDFGIDV